MATVAEPRTLADALRDLGNVDPARIRMSPAPGAAEPMDVERIRAREKRLFELVDGILVEKVMGFRESMIAIVIGAILRSFVSERNLGLVVGADGMMRLFADTVRIPDVAFVAWDKLPEGRVPDQPVPHVVPTLAVEVLSASNTKDEMERKRKEYFTAGVALIWEVELERRLLTSFSAPNSHTEYTEHETVRHVPILPGFELSLREVFSELDKKV